MAASSSISINEIGTRLFDMYVDRRGLVLSDDTLGIVILYMISVDEHGNVTWGGLYEGIYKSYYSRHGFDIDESEWDEDFDVPVVHDALSQEYKDILACESEPDVSDEAFAEGDVMKICCYHNGKRHGKYIKYDKYGQVENYRFYVRGLLHGTSIRYLYEHTEITKYKHGVKHGEERIILKGRMTKVSDYVDGKLVKYREYDSYDKLLKQATCGCDAVHWEHMRWNVDGILIERSMFTGDIRHGPRERWNDDGTVYSKSNYVNGKLDGEYIEYYPDGKLYLRYQYRAGVMCGECRRYNRDGSYEIVGKPRFED